jgi:hypothetical protein
LRHINDSYLIGLTEIVLALVSFALAFYVFVKTEISAAILNELNALFSFSGYSGITVMAAIFTVVFIIAITLRKGAFFARVVCYLSWALIVPAILGFSQFDWLRLFQMPDDFNVFHTALSLTAVLDISLIIAGCQFFFLITDRLRATQKELVKRKAPAGDVEAAIRHAFGFSFAVVSCCVIAVFLTSLALPFAKPMIEMLLADIPYSYLIITCAVFACLAVGVALYLTGEAEVGHTQK